MSGVKVFGEEFGAASDGGGGEDGGIPEGGRLSLLDIEGMQHDLRGDRDNTVAQPVLNQCRGFLVRQWVRACGAGGLNIKFLKHLNREREVWVAQDRFSRSCFSRLLRVGGDGVEEDVGIDKGHLAAAFVEVFPG